MAQSVYNKLSLPPNAIRLFTLQPGAPRKPLVGDLSIADLHDQTQRWIALSYVWGDPGEVSLVTISGHEFYITKHLERGLLELRHPEKTTVVWVDQICINQSNDEELGAQILLMDRIYEGAEKTLVWLGETTNDMSTLFHALRQLSDETFEKYIATSDKAHGGDEQIWRRICQAMFIPSSDDKETFDKLDWLLKRSWFQRIWTIQEAVFPARLDFQVGSFTLSSNHLERVLRMLTESGHSSLSSVHSGRFVKPAAILELCALFTGGIPSQVDYPVLLDCTKYRGTSNDKDRVYGLLGLINGHHVVNKFQPSYTKSVETIYMEMMFALLEADKSPDPLKFCCTERKSNFKVPSWVEDWSVAEGCGAQSARSMLKRPRIYNVATKLPYHAEMLVGDGCLKIRGVIVDTIISIVKPSICGDSTEDVWTAWRKRFDDLEALCRAIVADQDTDCGTFRRASQVSIQKLVDWAASVQPNQISKALEDLKHSLPHAAARFKDALRLFGVFKTSSGLIGQSCKHIEAGDRVALLFGGKLPFILREVPQISAAGPITYKIVGGECFITGLADFEDCKGLGGSVDHYLHIV